MGLYIPDLRLPANDDFELWIAVRKDGSFTYNIRVGWQDGKQKAIPIPPHGRLIDADEFLKRAIGTKCFRGDYVLMLEELVGESTTIIPPKEET